MWSIRIRRGCRPSTNMILAWHHGRVMTRVQAVFDLNPQVVSFEHERHHRTSMGNPFNEDSQPGSIYDGMFEVPIETSGMSPEYSKSGYRNTTYRLGCEQCDNVYTGAWAHRNLARHVETKHPPPPPPGSTEIGQGGLKCAVCSRSYQRADALLKHERKRHPELKRALPIPRKKSDDHSRLNNSPSAMSS
ncbi:hypothetical protein BDV95DRAFT_299330 [Massariosphaeria phaeospora]|uniref:C2H2-type domain-containing protein n=1 Tax=Massariosphaeria phaeospora TaxID=100035 RepID=A0A7C8IE46_9PLEO|nr:hypothetical protein BDV95DRAFT_299330 [Massariosphaeria phaeospora]